MKFLFVQSSFSKSLRHITGSSPVYQVLYNVLIKILPELTTRVKSRFAPYDFFKVEVFIGLGVSAVQPFDFPKPFWLNLGIYLAKIVIRVLKNKFNHHRGAHA